MGYYAYICAQLQPLRLYDLSTGTGAEELKTVGAALDALAEALEETEAESCPLTAGERGLASYETLLPYAPVSETLAQRQQALAAMLRIDGRSFTKDALNATLSGCGITASVEETDTPFTVQVSFPGTMGTPAEFPALQARIEAILPCHLAVEYLFRYLLWQELEANLPTWDALEAAAASWAALEGYSAA